MNSFKLITTAAVALIAGFAASAQATEIRVAEPMVITAKRIQAVKVVRVAEPIVIVAKSVKTAPTAVVLNTRGAKQAA
jgi:hypothetical protein